jgi:hypothetical protein
MRKRRRRNEWRMGRRRGRRAAFLLHEVFQ